MPTYYLNQQAQATGEHEVHAEGCAYMPSPGNRVNLGYHMSCESALAEARRFQSNVDGCYYCCKECHKR